ncbi:MAG: DUF2147 domain-containing protein [Bacteroidales bacterium]|nr:DUF2147 domain-containing protein [Bacteroidales bacterium]
MVSNKALFILTIAVIFFSVTSKSQTHSDDILGKWLTEKNEAIVQIFKTSDGKYAGKIIWLKEPLNEQGKPKTDIHNPNPELRQRPILNLVFMAGFVYNDNEWENGIIYDAKSGNTYKAKITMTDKNTLNLRGYIGSPMFGRTTVWKRKFDK